MVCFIQKLDCLAGKAKMMFLEKTFVWKMKRLQDYVPKHAEEETSSKSTLAILLESTFRASSPQGLASKTSVSLTPVKVQGFSMGNRLDRKAFSISPLQKLRLSCFCPGTLCKTLVSLRLQLSPSSTHF